MQPYMGQLSQLRKSSLRTAQAALDALAHKKLSKGAFDDANDCGCVMVAVAAYKTAENYNKTFGVHGGIRLHCRQLAKTDGLWQYGFYENIGDTRSFDKKAYNEVNALYNLNDNFIGTPEERYDFVYSAIQQELLSRGCGE